MVALWLIAGGLIANALPFEHIEKAWALKLGSRLTPVYLKLVD